MKRRIIRVFKWCGKVFMDGSEWLAVARGYESYIQAQQDITERGKRHE